MERIEEAGEPQDIADNGFEFTKLDLTEDEGNDIYDNFDDCGVDMREALLESMQSDEEIEPEMAQCMEDAITDDNLRAFFVTMMVQGEDGAESSEAGEELTSKLMECAMAGVDMEEFETE